MSANLSQRVMDALAHRDLKSAHQYCQQILQTDPQNADGFFLMGVTIAESGQFKNAIEWFHKSINLAPNNPEYLTQLAKSHIMLSDTINAQKFADRAYSLNPRSPMIIDTLGVVYSKLGLHKKAVSLFSRAVADNQNNPALLLNLATSLKFVGDFDGAREAYEKVIQRAPHFYKAHSGLTSLGGITDEHNHIERLTRQLTRAKNNVETLHLCHAIAKEYESLGDYDQAFDYLNKGKRQRLASIDYNFNDESKLFDVLKSYFNQSSIEFATGHSSAEPIFIVGMPRTGTTLVERIVSNHPDVTTIGESHQLGVQLKKLSQTKTNRVLDPETITAMDPRQMANLAEAYLNATRPQTGSTKYFVDKMPLNFLLVGFIAKALPNAKIICVHRHPLDTCASNYRQLFSLNTPYYNYGYELENTAKYYLLFRDLMDFWNSRFSKNIYTLNYESLVNSPQNESQKLLAFLNLDWQPQLLDIDQNEAPVATASSVQVRNPINNRSVGNWRKYQKHFAPIIELMNAHQINVE